MIKKTKTNRFMLLNIYKALSGERIPTFDTILKVMSALGLKLHAEAMSY